MTASPVTPPGMRYDESRQWLLPQGLIARQLASHQLADRPKRGSRAAAFDELSGNTTLGVHLSQIAPGGTKPGHRHVDEAVIYVVDGRGWSEMRQADDAPDQRVEWKTGDLVAIPSNAWHQHFNADPDRPALQLAFKNTRMLRRLFGSRDFVYASNARLHERYDDEPDYWTLREQADDGRVRTNVIRDCASEVLAPAPGAGRGVSLQEYVMGGNLTLDVVIVEVVRRGHVRAHSHLAEEAIYVLAGRGRSIFWDETGRELVVRWRAGDLLCPPLGVWHQHLTEGHDPARLLVARNNFVQRAFGSGHGLFGTQVPARLPLEAEPGDAVAQTHQEIATEE